MPSLALRPIRICFFYPFLVSCCLNVFLLLVYSGQAWSSRCHRKTARVALFPTDTGYINALVLVWWKVAAPALFLLHLELLLPPVETGKWKLEDGLCQHYLSSKESVDWQALKWDANFKAPLQTQGFLYVKSPAVYVLSEPYQLINFQANLIWWAGPFKNV